MSRKIVFGNTDYIIKLYLSGMSAANIASKFEVSQNSILRLLHENNVTIIKSRARIRPSIDDIMAIYNTGIGASGVARVLGCGRTYVNSMLDKNGINKRNQSEQQFARMARTTPDERQKLSKAAHDAVRGKKRSAEELEKRSLSKYHTKNICMSEYEFQFSDELTKKGILFDTQVKVGPYNCDFVINGIAVEIFGGQWHLFGSHAARFHERTKKFFDSGYSILFVFIRQGHKVDTEIADQILSNVDILSKNKTAVREYRVVWSGLDYFSGQSSDADNLAIVVPFTNRRNPTTGRYETVSK